MIIFIIQNFIINVKYKLMKNRQIQLQNIIKTLQSKIHALKSQYAASKAEEKIIIQQAIIKEKELSQQKEKTIAFLKEELNKVRKQHQKDISLTKEYYQQQIGKRNEQLSSLESINNDLQSKLLKSQQVLQSKLKQKQQQIIKIKNHSQNMHKQNKKLLQQIEDFNKFYLNSVQKLPQRQQTLLWVDKFIEFMGKTQNIFNNDAKQKQETLNNIYKYLKEQLNALNHQHSKNDGQIIQYKQKFIDTLSSLLKEAEEDYDDAIKSNQEFWDNFFKIKLKQDKQLVARLQSELIQMQEKHRKQTQDLQDNLRNSQKEKKNLIISFQQMKNIYEIREKTSKQQIQLLKQSINSLLSSQQIRERQFQNEIERLAEKIQHITNKFYEKLQIPIEEMANRVRMEVQNFKNQFQGFYTDTLLQNQLKNFQKHIVQYLISLNNSKQQRKFLRQIAQGSLKMIQMIKSTDFQHPSGMKEQNDKRMAYSSISYSKEQRSDDGLEKQKRLSYQVAIMKKQIDKFKEYIKQLQSKSVKNKDKNTTAYKIIEISAQNQVLKDKVMSLQRGGDSSSFMSQNKLYDAKLSRLNSTQLQKLLENSQLILKFTQNQNSYIDKISHCITSLNTFIINPIQMFQRLICQINNIRFFPDSSLSTVRQNMQQSKENHFDEIKQSASLLSLKKSQNQSMFIKASGELSKVLRESIAKINTNARTIRSNQQKKLQNDKVKVLQSRNVLEKRVKEVQTQRIKNRQQMLAKLKILQTKLKSIQQKSSKKNPQSFTKFQQSILKKVQQLCYSLSARQKLKDISKITESIFNDMQSKLKQCLIQNEALLKENQLLKKLRK